MKAQRDLMQQVDARGVVFGLFAIIVICAAMPLGLDHGPTSKKCGRASDCFSDGCRSPLAQYPSI
jgi:hypothetical protein